MKILFDLELNSAAWASTVDNQLLKDWPEYIQQYGNVGSKEWWMSYNSGLIHKKVKMYSVTFLGERTYDLSSELEDVITLKGDKAEIEYDRVGYWNDSRIKVGSIIELESFTICIKQRYGPMSFSFDKQVKLLS